MTDFRPEDMPEYKPSRYVQENASRLWKTPHLPGLVRRAIDEGYVVLADYGEGEEYYERLTKGHQAVRAANEVEWLTLLLFRPGAQTAEGFVSVIASNGDDWLADYSVRLEDLIRPTMDKLVEM